jgi:hypothetical protein
MVIEHSSDVQEEMIHHLDPVMTLVGYQDDDAKEKKTIQLIINFRKHTFGSPGNLA